MSVAARTAGPDLRETSAAPRSRSRLLALVIALAFVAVGGQLVRLAWQNEDVSTIRVSMMSSPAKTLARPDIVDRNGRLLATDVQMPSLYADPLLIQDADDAAERLVRLFPQLDVRELRQSLADKSRRFVWVRRGLSPAMAQRVHNLGIPGLLFVDENPAHVSRRTARRAYSRPCRYRQPRHGRHRTVYRRDRCV